MAKIIIGLGYGDEGKGLATSYLCSKYPKHSIVIRFNGGHQAGHTVVHNGERHIFSSFGSGTLQGIPTFWSKYCTVYPTALVNEFEILKSHNPILYVDPMCPLTTPFDVEFNQQVARQRGSNTHGSVGVGFGDTLQRQEDNYKLFVQDIFYPSVFERKLENIRRYYHDKGLLNALVINLEVYLENVEMMKQIVKLEKSDILGFYSNHIFEGAQGIMLDQSFGFFPNVTRSNCTSQNALEICKEVGITEDDIQIYYITRSYSTRHGNGYLHNEQEIVLKNAEKETNVTHAFQGNFRKAPLDKEILNYAINCDSNFAVPTIEKNLVITCLDQHQIDVRELLKFLPEFKNVYISNGDSHKNITQI